MNFMERLSSVIGKQYLFKQDDGRYYNRHIEGYQTKKEAQCDYNIKDVILKDKEPFVFTYINWKGETSIRKAIPIETVYEINEFHGDKPLWLLKAYDLDKDDIRYFDMSKINI